MNNKDQNIFIADRRGKLLKKSELPKGVKYQYLLWNEFPDGDINQTKLEHFG